MNQGPDISDRAIVCIVTLAVAGAVSLLVAALAGVDALLSHLQWIP